MTKVKITSTFIQEGTGYCFAQIVDKGGKEACLPCGRVGNKTATELATEAVAKLMKNLANRATFTQLQV